MVVLASKHFQSKGFTRLLSPVGATLCIRNLTVTQNYQVSQPASITITKTLPFMEVLFFLFKAEREEWQIVAHRHPCTRNFRETRISQSPLSVKIDLFLPFILINNILSSYFCTHALSVPICAYLFPWQRAASHLTARFHNKCLSLFRTLYHLTGRRDSTQIEECILKPPIAIILIIWLVARVSTDSRED